MGDFPGYGGKVRGTVNVRDDFPELGAAKHHAKQQA
jgi:hypothetical protein